MEMSVVDMIDQNIAKLNGVSGVLQMLAENEDNNERSAMFALMTDTTREAASDLECIINEIKDTH